MPPQTRSKTVGARNGNTGDPGPGFDADQRSAARESKPVIIGGQVLKRAKKVWTVTNQLAEISVRQERLQRKRDRFLAQAEEVETKAVAADEEPDEDRIEDLREQARDVDNQAGLLTYELLACLLRDDEGRMPPVSLLQDNLDVEDVLALATELQGAGPDPTPTSDMPTTSSS